MTAQTRATHLADAEITAYIDGQLLPAQRADVTAHLDACAECRGEVAEVIKLLRDAPVSTAPASATRTKKSVWRTGIGIALAASVVTVLLMREGREPPTRASAVRSSEPSLNTEARGVVTPVSPGDQAAVTGAGITFVWRSTGATLYRISVTSPDGQQLWVHDTRDTTALLSRNVNLEAGYSYFWYVDAIGEGIYGTTGLQRFKVVP